MVDRNFTLIYYYVPEDMDDIDVPNAFGIKKGMQDICVSDIQACFPMEGRYHFRFKYKYGTEYVWMDVPKPDSKPPIVDGKIVFKATRKSWEGKTSNNVTTAKPVKDVFNGLTDDFESLGINEPKTQAPIHNVSLNTNQ